MIKYIYPSESQYAKLLGGDFGVYRFDITKETDTLTIGYEYAKTIPQAQTISPDLNIGVIGVRGSGKSSLSSKFLSEAAGDVSVIEQGKKGMFRGFSQNVGDILRYDTWNQPAATPNKDYDTYLQNRIFGRGLLVVEHGQYNETINYNIMMTLNCHDATDELPAARTLDIRIQPNLAQTKTFQNFIRKTKGLSL